MLWVHSGEFTSHPGIMYGSESEIWSSLNKMRFEQLDALNRKFFIYVAFKIGSPMHFTDHDYTSTL